MTISPLADPKLFRQYRTLPHPLPAVFLDRDGVIVQETGYLHRPEDVQFIPEAAQAIRSLNIAGIPVVVVTNQAGIGRGYYEWADFHAVQNEIASQLNAVGAQIDGVWACGHHPAHPFRKPEPGMLLDAAAAMRIDLEHSWLVGDKISDIEAAVRAGLAGAALVRTGYGREHEAQLGKAHWDTRCLIRVFDSLAAANEWLIAQCRL
jgi:D-glycero-D-manno-heptose 1,7-bisphosphate phosphatase